MSSQTRPSSIRAGDSLSWLESLSSYPASAGWALSFRLIPQAGAGALDIEATAAGDDFAVSVSAASTRDLPPGEYTLAGALTRNDERVMLCSDVCPVLPDLMAAASLDGRSPALKIVEAIDAWLSGRAGWAGEKTVGDRSIKDHPIPDLITLRDRFARDVASEEAAANLFNGLGNARGRVMVRM